MDNNTSPNVPGFTFGPQFRMNYPIIPSQNYPTPQASSPIPFTSSAWQTTQYASPNPLQSVQRDSTSFAISIPSTSKPASEPKTKKRAPAWTPLEEEVLIRIYKEEAESSQKKGKKSQTMWSIIAEKLDKEAEEIGFTANGRSAQKVKEKFFNMIRRYKQCKDKIKTTGEASEDIEICPHFELLDEFMGSKDSVNPKFVVESRSSSPSVSPRPCTPSSNDGGAESDATSDSFDLEGESKQENSKKRAIGSAKKLEKKRKHNRTLDEEDDKWMTFLRESQAREERMMESFKKSEENFKELFITAIKEFGKIVKKE